MSVFGDLSFKSVIDIASLWEGSHRWVELEVFVGFVFI